MTSLKMRRLTQFGLILFLAFPAMTANGNEEDRSYDDDAALRAARLRMVDEQIRARGIKDERVLSAIATVPRHNFVPTSLISRAYDDNPLPIGHDQTISQPYIVALMTEAAHVQPTDRVLEIGTGSGYQAAILSLLAKDVFSIEIVEPLGKAARELLWKLGYHNVEVRIGDGYRGWPEEAPFDVIIVTAAPEELPQALIDQLADGGRMVLPVGSYYQELFILTREGDSIKKEKLANVRFVPMVHDPGD